jgi:hypothetical protein
VPNITTRPPNTTGADIAIAVYNRGNHTGLDRVVLRGIGPSLSSAGVQNPLSDPALELRDGNGSLLRADNDWPDDPIQAAQLTAAGLAPSNRRESGIVASLPPGHYTVLLAGQNNVTGIGLVEVYDLGP